MTGFYRLADLKIEITSTYRYIHDFCRDYRVEEGGCPPDFAVRPAQADIEYERKKPLRLCCDADRSGFLRRNKKPPHA